MDPHQYGTASDPSQTERITDPARIAQLIKRIKDTHKLLTVTVPRARVSYLSAVLDVDFNGATFTLDELTPADGHLAVVAAGRLSAYVQCDGVDISFSASVARAEHDTDGNFYRLTLPEFVFYRQRREHYRVRIGHGHPIPLSIGPDPVARMQGVLHDISAGGLGGEFQRYRGPDLVLGQVLPGCELRIDDRHVIQLNLEVRYVQVDGLGGRLRLGARYLDLCRPEQKLIDQLVASLDRDWRRKLMRERTR
jgi:c-di-GMP-binding flagellar brake protein YcgR